jgi:hypothetical protein
MDNTEEEDEIYLIKKLSEPIMHEANNIDCLKDPEIIEKRQDQLDFEYASQLQADFDREIEPAARNTTGIRFTQRTSALRTPAPASTAPLGEPTKYIKKVVMPSFLCPVCQSLSCDGFYLDSVDREEPSKAVSSTPVRRSTNTRGNPLSKLDSKARGALMEAAREKLQQTYTQPPADKFVNLPAKMTQCTATNPSKRCDKCSSAAFDGGCWDRFFASKERPRSGPSNMTTTPAIASNKATGSKWCGSEPAINRNYKEGCQWLCSVCYLGVCGPVCLNTPGIPRGLDTKDPAPKSPGTCQSCGEQNCTRLICLGPEDYPANNESMPIRSPNCQATTKDCTICGKKAANAKCGPNWHPQRELKMMNMMNATIVIDRDISTINAGSFTRS